MFYHYRNPTAISRIGQATSKGSSQEQECKQGRVKLSHKPVTKKLAISNLVNREQRQFIIGAFEA